MSKVLLHADSTPGRGFDDTAGQLYVSELFSHTIQGEGRFTGWPAVFLRLKGCTLNCTWCDTAGVWRRGSKYTFDELVSLLKENDAVDFLKDGAHLVITGGAPLLQQEKVKSFIHYFISTCGFKPFIEVENECVLIPDDGLMRLVDHWNCSPKLSNSSVKPGKRWNTEAAAKISAKGCCDFKFVISDEKDWDEIQKHFIDEGLISRRQIILMPEGSTREELNLKRERTVDLAVEKGVRFSDRLHITIWDKKTGV